jgi:hypothetical protein
MFNKEGYKQHKVLKKVSISMEADGGREKAMMNHP